jgi:tetrapyrrole methylase family protein/MazG family protein
MGTHGEGWPAHSEKRRMSENTATPDDAPFLDLVGLMARLRSPEGCPWDREQDHRSLRRCLLEEAYEVLAAVDAEDFEALREELGDLLLQVVFHAQLAAEEGHFTAMDVVRRLHDKLIARHPHVFGSASAETAAEVLEQWHHLKRRERGEATDAGPGVPAALPALARAQVVLRRAARSCRPPSAEETRRSVDAALEHFADGPGAGRAAEAAIGRILFAVIELAGAAGVDAEQALREHVDRFIAQTWERTLEAPPPGATPEAPDPG